ncbi:MAG: hypothetical protein ABWZ74_06770 [Hyphomicrobiaceae bacterium]
MLIELLITVLVVGLIAGIAWWIITSAPFIPEPIKGFAAWAVVAIALIILVIKIAEIGGVSI